jgi:hypothetical protein
MPVERRRPKHGPAPAFYDFRGAANGYGVNGFVNLTLRGRALAVHYLDLDGTEILREKFIAAQDGAVRLESREKLIGDLDFLCAG